MEIQITVRLHAGYSEPAGYLRWNDLTCDVPMGMVPPVGASIDLAAITSTHTPGISEAALDAHPLLLALGDDFEHLATVEWVCFNIFDTVPYVNVAVRLNEDDTRHVLEAAEEHKGFWENPMSR